MNSMKIFEIFEYTTAYNFTLRYRIIPFLREILKTLFIAASLFKFDAQRVSVNTKKHYARERKLRLYTVA